MKIGKREYTPVNERILEFHKQYKNGSIRTEIISHHEGIVLMRALVIPDIKNPESYFTGFATEYKDDPKSFVNKTSYIENCETSSVGRALGMLGIGIQESFASSDEIEVVKSKEKKNSGLKCDNCKKDISYAEKNYSNTKYGKVLCYGCQKLENPKPKEEPLIDAEGEEIPF